MTDTDLLQTIPARDWEATPASVRTLLSLLPLAEEVSELRAQLNEQGLQTGNTHSTEISDQRIRIERYQSLVDRSFLNGITQEERQEMDRLGTEIDSSNAPLFQVALQRMQAEAESRKSGWST